MQANEEIGDNRNGVISPLSAWAETPSGLISAMTVVAIPRRYVTKARLSSPTLLRSVSPYRDRLLSEARQPGDPARTMRGKSVP